MRAEPQAVLELLTRAPTVLILTVNRGADGTPGRRLTGCGDGGVGPIRAP